MTAPVTRYTKEDYLRAADEVASPHGTNAGDLCAMLRQAAADEQERHVSWRCFICDLKASECECTGYGPDEATVPQAAAEGQGNDQRGWVIERHIGNVLHYWTGRPDGMLDGFSPKHADALRFARREDANAMLTWHLDAIGNVVEHLWMPATPTEPTPPPAVDVPRCGTCCSYGKGQCVNIDSIFGPVPDDGSGHCHLHLVEAPK